VLAAPARAVVLDDPSDTWAHDVTRFQDEIGAFEVLAVRTVEHGPVKSTLRVESRFGDSHLTQDYTVFDGLEPIEVRVRVDWRERRRALKLRFPVNVRFHRATFEIPFGRIERPVSGEEEPGQAWVDLSGVHRATDRLYGLSVINDAKYSYDVRGRELALTVLRSPVYAHHDPFQPLDWDALQFIDQGVQRFTYALLPHTGGWETAGTVRRSAELNQRAAALVDTWHRGDLPRARSFVEVSPENVFLTALKAAEDSSGDVVLRVYETAGRATRGEVWLSAWGRAFQFDLGAFEIKTFRVPRDRGMGVTEADLLERPLPALVSDREPVAGRI
jgi:alpha-mannosidase